MEIYNVNRRNTNFIIRDSSAIDVEINPGKWRTKVSRTLLELEARIIALEVNNNDFCWNPVKEQNTKKKASYRYSY